MPYIPQINDYVTWKKEIEGWIYFIDKDYVTIETRVIPKDPENIQHCSLHRNNRLLVLCYEEQWKELNCIGYRSDKYSETIISTEK